MSRFTTVKSMIKDKEMLLETLKELNHEYDISKVSSVITLKKHNIQFKQMDNGFFSIRGDRYHTREIENDIIQKCQTKVAIRDLRRKGYQVKQQSTTVNKEIKLVMVRR